MKSWTVKCSQLTRTTGNMLLTCWLINGPRPSSTSTCLCCVRMPARENVFFFFRSSCWKTPCGVLDRSFWPVMSLFFWRETHSLLSPERIFCFLPAAHFDVWSFCSSYCWSLWHLKVVCCWLCAHEIIAGCVCVCVCSGDKALASPYRPPGCTDQVIKEKNGSHDTLMTVKSAEHHGKKEQCP